MYDHCGNYIYNSAFDQLIKKCFFFFNSQFLETAKNTSISTSRTTQLQFTD